MLACLDCNEHDAVLRVGQSGPRHCLRQGRPERQNLFGDLPWTGEGLIPRRRNANTVGYVRSQWRRMHDDLLFWRQVLQEFIELLCGGGFLGDGGPPDYLSGHVALLILVCVFFSIRLVRFVETLSIWGDSCLPPFLPFQSG